MVLIQGWYPPNRENYDMILFLWQCFPIVRLTPSYRCRAWHLTRPQFASLQWAISWYGMGKTSVQSRLNLPGRFAWMIMECPGFMTLLYNMNTLPAQEGVLNSLPWQNKVLAALFVRCPSPFPSLPERA